MMDAETTAIQKIKSNGNRPEEWLEFLALQQSTLAADLTDENCRHLLYLYERAVSQIPAEENKKNISYAHILVNFAKLQMKISKDDARSTFQLARNNAKHFAIVFVAWAQFELSAGNRSKCRSLLRKGKDSGAEPKELLLKAYDNFVAQRKVLIEESEELTGFTGYRANQKSSESSVDMSPLSTEDESSTGTNTQLTEAGTAKVSDNTTAVISFKLPSVLESCGKKPLSCRRSNSSSSSDETDSILYQSSTHRQRGSMSTQKPSVKSTPDFKSDSLAGCMNLSVRRHKARRGGGIHFGLPMRVKRPLPALSEPGDELDGITELDCTVEVPQQQSCEPETAASNQIHGLHLARSSVHSASTKKDMTKEQSLSPASGSQKETSGEHYEGRFRNNTVETQEIVAPQVTENLLYNQQSAGSYSFTANPQPAMLNNSCSTQQGEVSNSGRQPMLYQIPTPQGLPSASSQVIDGSVTIRKQSTNSTAPPAERNGSQLQKKTAQVSHSGPLHSTPGQLLGAGCAPGYPQEMQFSRSAAVPAQSSQETIRVKGKLYQRLGTIGKGGSSKVFQGFDGKRICAIKCVNLEEADEFIVRSYINEVQLLERLQGNDNIIKLFDWELSQDMSSLILVMECGSIDLAGFLRKNRTKITESELQVFWRQMLEAVHVIHEARIIHRDLKPANFLLVEGRLKLIDFGIANSLQGDKTSVELETQVGTLNFMSPEAFQDISHAPRFDSAGNAKPRMKIGRASDVWSLGCILHMMVYGRTPFQHITNHIFKLQCIMDPSHVIEFPEIKDKNLLDVMKGCLLRNPKERYTIPQLLAHPYINPPSHDPPVEIEDEDKMFHVLMEFAKADVNSPRSVRALSKTFYKQLLTGKKVSLSSAAPQSSIPMHSQSPRQVRQIPPRQVLEPVIRQPLVGIDVKALNQAQKALKPPHASGNAKYMKENDREQDKENPDLDGLLKHELLEKYKNAHPRNTSEFSFEQTWNTTYED